MMNLHSFVERAVFGVSVSPLDFATDCDHRPGMLKSSGLNITSHCDDLILETDTQEKFDAAIRNLGRAENNNPRSIAFDLVGTVLLDPMLNIPQVIGLCDALGAPCIQRLKFTGFSTAQENPRPWSPPSLC